jgi:hypothetical protein
MTGTQSIQPRSNEALLPADNGRRRSSQSLLNRAERSEYISGRQASRLGDAAKFQLLLFVEHHRINRHARLDASRVSNVYSATGH